MRVALLAAKRLNNYAHLLGRVDPKVAPIITALASNFTDAICNQCSDDDVNVAIVAAKFQESL